MGALFEYTKPLRGNGYLDLINKEFDKDTSIVSVKFDGKLENADLDNISETLNAEFVELRGNLATFKSKSET